MARTAEGEELTAQQSAAQLAIQAMALRAFIRLWPLWQGDDRTFNHLVAATVPLVGGFYRLSASVASDYYQAFRRAEKIPGNPTPRLGAIDEDRVTAGLHVTGRIMTRKALLAGQPAEKAMQTALVRTSGSVTRHVLQGGRDTVILSTAEDRQAEGWQRVTKGKACAFCAMLASRGGVYKGPDTAAFETHLHCNCGVEPVYLDSKMPPDSRRYRDLYNQAVREAKQAGELERGTSNDSLNAFRRLLAQQP